MKKKVFLFLHNHAMDGQGIVHQTVMLYFILVECLVEGLDVQFAPSIGSLNRPTDTSDDLITCFLVFRKLIRNKLAIYFMWSPSCRLVCDECDVLEDIFSLPKMVVTNDSHFWKDLLNCLCIVDKNVPIVNSRVVGV